MSDDMWVELEDYPGYRVSPDGRAQSCRRFWRYAKGALAL